MSDFRLVEVVPGRRWVLRHESDIAPQRSDLPAPGVITDCMQPLQHVDGNTYDSKAAFRRVTKARGYVEVGNDPARFDHSPVKPDTTKSVREAVEKAAARVARNDIALPQKEN
jgi:hypothetical protein